MKNINGAFIMNKENISISKARNKRNIIALLVIVSFVCGGIFEYQQATFPLDEAVIFLSPTDVAEQDTTVTNPIIEQDQSSAIAQDNNPQALQDFLGYIDEINQTTDEILSHKNNVLDNIHATETDVSQTPKVKPVFAEGKIEIYDSERGIIDVVDEGKSDSFEQDLTDITNEVANETVSKMAEDEELADKKATQVLQEQVFQTVKDITDNGEQAPVVLLPGVGIPAANIDAENEEINLEINSTSEIEKDMRFINGAIADAERRKQNTEPVEISKSKNIQDALSHMGITFEYQSDDDEAVDMLNQIKQ